MTQCRKLEPSKNGYVIQNLNNWKKFYSVDDLMYSQWCLNCSERFHCKLIEILERKNGK